MKLKKKIVVIGGGHGSSVILAGLKDKNVDLTVVISMADDGGSTGRLRRELSVSAMGDIRNCLAALCGREEFSYLFSYRFSSGQLAGHSLGNLFLAAGELTFEDLQASIDYARQALSVRAKIFPVTLDKPRLHYEGHDQGAVGTLEIAKIALESRPKLVLKPKASLSTQAKKAISQADLIIIAPGNFYCSIAQSLIVAGMSEALKETSAKIAMITNLVNLKRHTNHFSPADYLSELNRLLGAKVIDCVVFNTESIDPKNLKQDEEEVETDFSQNSYSDTSFKGEKLLDKRLVESDPNDKIAYARSKLHHDKHKLAEVILAL